MSNNRSWSTSLSLNFMRYLFYGTLAVNYFMWFAPMARQNVETCEEAKKTLPGDGFLTNLIATMMDLGLDIFHSAGAIAGVILPLLHWTLDSISQAKRNKPFMDDETRERLEAIEKEILQALSSPLLIYNAIQKATGLSNTSDTTRRILYSLTAAPVTVQAIGLGLQHLYSMDYKQISSWPAIQETFKNNKIAAWGLSSFQLINLGLLGFSLGTTASWFVLNQIDGTREIDVSPFITDLAILTSGGVGSIVMMLSFCKDWLRDLADLFSSTGNIAYLIAMVALSEMLCLIPTLETVDNYKRITVWVELTFTVLSLLAGYRITKQLINTHDKKNVLVPDANPSIQNEQYFHSIIDMSDEDFPISNSANEIPVTINTNMDNRKLPEQESIQSSIVENNPDNIVIAISSEQTSNKATTPENIPEIKSESKEIIQPESPEITSPLSDVIKSGFGTFSIPKIEIKEEVKVQSQSRTPSPRGSKNES